MENNDNLIPNERPQRLNDKIVEFFKKVFSKNSNSNELNSKAISEPNSS